MKSRSAVLRFLAFVTVSFIERTVLGAGFNSNCFHLQPSSEKIIVATKTEFHERFDLKSNDLYMRNRFETNLFVNFRRWVVGFTSINQLDLLSIQLKGLEQIKMDKENQIWLSNAKKRHMLIHQGRVGKINSTSCLVRMLFDKQLERFPQMVYPSEFMALILRSKTDLHLYRVYFSMGDGKTFDVSPPQNPGVWNLFGTDLSSGWEFFAHLHSHPFMIKYPQAPHVGGTVYPSDEDVKSYQYWSAFGLKEAWITNGFDMVRFTSEDIKLLQATIPSHVPYQGSK